MRWTIAQRLTREPSSGLGPNKQMCTTQMELPIALTQPCLLADNLLCTQKRCDQSSKVLTPMHRCNYLGVEAEPTSTPLDSLTGSVLLCSVCGQDRWVQLSSRRSSQKQLGSVTYLFNFAAPTDPNYAQPWQMRPQRSSSGSAFIVDMKRRHIMTNAHVVHLNLGHAMV